MLVVIEKACSAAVESKKAVFEGLIRKLSLAKATCQFRIKMGQNGLDKSHEI